MKNIFRFFICLTCLSALATAPAFAEDFEYKRSVGFIGFAIPKYEGSDEYVPTYLPLADFEYGPFFASVIKGLGVYIPVNESRTFLFAPALRWRVGRNLDDSYNPIEYIEHIRPTATINTIWKAEPFIFNFRITDGLSESDRGFSYNLGAAYNYEYSEKIELSFYTTAIYGSKTYNQTYFGITSGQTWFGYPEYSARAGLKSIDFGANIKYKLTGAWTIESTAEVLRLTGVAAESPIVRDPNQFMLTLGASYSF